MDFKKYEAWCKKNKLNPSDPNTLAKYNEEANTAEEKAARVAKQKALFGQIAEYVGVDVEYDERAFDFLEKSFLDLIFTIKLASIVASSVDDLKNFANKISKEGE